MNKTVAFIAIILTFAFSALPPAYAASHEKKTATTATDSASEGTEDQKEDEEPECD